MYDVKVVTSTKQVDCGPTCLKMLLDYYGIEVDLDTLIRECNTRITGCTGLDLKRVGNAHGLDMHAFKTESAEDMLYTDRPSIVHWKYGHWCIYCGLDKGQVVIVNPDRGKYHMSVDTFKSMYSGTFLTNGDPEDLPKDEEFTTADIIETLADHEYRVCLLELGINGNEEEL